MISRLRKQGGRILEKVDRNSIYYVFLEILRLHHHKIYNSLEEIGLYPGQPPLLFILNKNDGKSQRELADMMHVKASTMNVMIKRMEKGGLIERKSDLEDGRISRVYITDLGRDVCKKSQSKMGKIEDEMFSNLTKEELVIFRRLFIQVKNNLYKDEA